MSEDLGQHELEGPDAEAVELRLYIAGDSPNSTAAIANLRSICDSHLSGRYRIELIDVLRYPARALQDQVFVAPLLIKVSQDSEIRVAGSLSDRQRVINALGADGDRA